MNKVQKCKKNILEKLRQRYVSHNQHNNFCEMRTFYIKVLKNTYCARWNFETLSLTLKQNVYFMYRVPIYNALFISLLNSKLFCRKACIGEGGRDIGNSLLPAREGGGVVRGQSKFISTFLGPNWHLLSSLPFQGPKKS